MNNHCVINFEGGKYYEIKYKQNARIIARVFSGDDEEFHRENFYMFFLDIY